MIYWYCQVLVICFGERLSVKLSNKAVPGVYEKEIEKSSLVVLLS